MSTTKKLASVNIGLILGFVAALFMVPPETPVWRLGMIFALTGAVMNYAVLKRQKNRTIADRGSAGSRANWIISAGLLLLVLDVAITRSCQHR
jgi:Mg2+/citrate symporter